MSRFYCWTGYGDCNDTTRLIDGRDEEDAAQSYALSVADINEGYEEDDRDTVEVSVTPEERPHKAPRHWEVDVRYEFKADQYTTRSSSPSSYALALARGEDS